MANRVLESKWHLARRVRERFTRDVPSNQQGQFGNKGTKIVVSELDAT